MDDAGRVISAQLGRDLRAKSDVVATCPLGLPVTIAVPPILDDGTPFPTRYWLTCPLAVRRIGRIEASGEIRRLDEQAGVDPEFGQRLSAANDRYRKERDALIPVGAQHRPRGGVAGAESGIKCLHAHYADHIVGNDNPVGEGVAALIEPLDCTIPCVVGGLRNPDWREPRKPAGHRMRS